MGQSREGEEKYYFKDKAAFQGRQALGVVSALGSMRYQASCMDRECHGPDGDREKLKINFAYSTAV